MMWQGNKQMDGDHSGFEAPTGEDNSNDREEGTNQVFHHRVGRILSSLWRSCNHSKEDTPCRLHETLHRISQLSQRTSKSKSISALSKTPQNTQGLNSLSEGLQQPRDRLVPTRNHQSTYKYQPFQQPQHYVLWMSVSSMPFPSPFYWASFSTNKFMKEQSDLRKSFLNDTLPTTTRQTTTRRTTIVPEMPFTQSTRKSSMAFADLDHPPLLKEQRYERLFQDTLRDTKRVYKYLASEQETAEQAAIKQGIARVLHEAEEEHDFNERFLIKPKLRAKTARVKRNEEKHIGLRSEQREAEKRRSFFSNHKKIIGLEEECMLLEYFLKDEDQHRQKTPIAYLAHIPHTSRHRRLTPTARQAAQLHSKHDPQEYRSLKRRVHLKEEFVQRCAAVARKNLTFRRRENFREIEYILRENNRNMMEEGVLHDRTDQERLQLQHNNQLIRLFLRYQFFLSNNRVYEYFTEQCFNKFKMELFAIAPALTMREGDIDRKVAQILEFKQTKTLHYQDFKEVVAYIDDLAKIDLLALFVQKCPQYFEHPAEPLLKAHEHEIDRYMSSHKIKFLLHVIFHTFPNKLIGKKVLPIKLIPSLLKAYGITEKDFDLHHLFHCYHWMQHYDAGLTFEQFYRGSILMGVKGNNWKGIDHLLRKIDVKKYL